MTPLLRLSRPTTRAALTAVPLTHQNTEPDTMVVPKLSLSFCTAPSQPRPSSRPMAKKKPATYVGKRVTCPAMALVKAWPSVDAGPKRWSMARKPRKKLRQWSREWGGGHARRA